MMTDYYADVLGVIEQLGIKYEQVDSRGEIIAHCPLHEDRHCSLNINKDSGLWICHAGCGSGSLIQLVMAVNECGFEEAIGWLGHQVVEVEKSKLEELLEDRPPVTVPRTEDSLQLAFQTYSMTKMNKYFFDRGFTMRTLREWDIRYDELEKAVVVPVYTKEQRLAGVIKRLVPPILETESRYKYSLQFNKTGCLFGLDHWVGPGVILVEGALDCIWLHQCGQSSALSVLGSYFHKLQARQIKGMTDRVILCFDSDETGEKITTQAFKALKDTCDVWRCKLPDQCKDIQDVPESQVSKVIMSAERMWL